MGHRRSVRGSRTVTRRTRRHNSGSGGGLRTIERGIWDRLRWLAREIAAELRGPARQSQCCGRRRLVPIRLERPATQDGSRQGLAKVQYGGSEHASPVRCGATRGLGWHGLNAREGLQRAQRRGLLAVAPTVAWVADSSEIESPRLAVAGRTGEARRRRCDERCTVARLGGLRRRRRLVHYVEDGNV
ncbi:pollen-specific leucine-rich repeat extensin-like protein 4 [Iris pallida]|uniref:Pollen-specific leucine-rich repeat extensin-like protein 4 n=1 Tax=Iris pallida TaxID=29817 RepID=A0AAX6EWX2_IRIPA|nr:pollen-specific leucine-rich repeat extensin-like protein 4 [Iris pallida]